MKPEIVNEIFIRDSLVEVSIQHIIMDLFGKHVSHYRHCPESVSEMEKIDGRKIYAFTSIVQLMYVRRDTASEAYDNGKT